MLNLNSVKKIRENDYYREETGIEKEYILAGAFGLLSMVSTASTAVSVKSGLPIMVTFCTALSAIASALGLKYTLSHIKMTKQNIQMAENAR